MSKKILTPEDTAELLQVTPGTVRGWLRKGVIRGAKVCGGRLWRISESTIDEFIGACKDNYDRNRRLE